jgi:hypothetical protein
MYTHIHYHKVLGPSIRLKCYEKGETPLFCQILCEFTRQAAKPDVCDIVPGVGRFSARAPIRLRPFVPPERGVLQARLLYGYDGGLTVFADRPATSARAVET